MNTRLGWRDVWSSVLVVIGLVAALSVTQGWGWPLLSGVREDIIALAILGLVACVLGAPRERSYYTDPFGVIFLGLIMVAVLVAIVGGLVVANVDSLVALMAVTFMLWAWATLRHAVEGRVTTRVETAA